MKVSLYTQKDRQRWQTYVEQSETATLYHLIDWKDLVEETFSHRTYYLLAENQDGVITGVLPLVHLKSLLFGSFMVSLPYFNYGGICTVDLATAEALLDESKRIARRVGAEFVELRHTTNLIRELPVKKTKVSMRLELPSDPQVLWKALGSKLRSQVKRPSNEGMSARFGKMEFLDDFYSVFSVNMRDLGTPVYPKKFFGNILEIFPRISWVCTVYSRDKKPVASGFLIGFRDRLEIPWASSLRKYNRLAPNMLLYWKVLEFACQHGYRIFDFGRSTPGEGTHRFKKQWGAKPVQFYWHYWVKNNGPIPELNPKNPKYQLAIRLWQRFPVPITRLIGPSIVRNIP